VAASAAQSAELRGPKNISDPSAKRPAIEFSRAQNHEPRKSRKQDLINSPSCLRVLSTRDFGPRKFARSRKYSVGAPKTCGHGPGRPLGLYECAYCKALQRGQRVLRDHEMLCPSRPAKVWEPFLAADLVPWTPTQRQVRQCGLRRRMPLPKTMFVKCSISGIMSSPISQIQH
jgi:hypothetical protein